MNNKLKTILTAGFLVAGMATNACTLTAWDSNSGAAAGGPADANVIARYSGLCGMDGTAGTVTNNGVTAVSGPSAEAAMIARFYFLASGAGTAATLFETYSENGASTPVYTVTYDGTNVVVTPADAGVTAGSAVSVPVGATNWHSVEVKWASGGAANSIEVWVDSDATAVAADGNTTSSTVGTSIQAAKLGGIANTGFTQLLFDDYESRRSTSIGRLLVGDATGDTNINIIDAISIVNEINGTPSVGVPDCTEDGAINIIDAICVVNIINAAP